MNVKNFAASAVAIGGLALAGPALAQLKDSGWYIGGGLGQTKVNIDEAGVNAGLIGAGFATASTSSDDTDTGWKIFGGYQLNKNVAFELTYADLGKFTTFSTTVPAGTFNATIKAQTNWSGDVIGILPLQGGFSLFGRVGLLYSETKADLAGTGAVRVRVSSLKDDDWSYKFGLGVGYDFTNNFGLRGEWERYHIPDGVGGHGDADLWSVSVRYKF